MLPEADAAFVTDPRLMPLNLLCSAEIGVALNVEVMRPAFNSNGPRKIGPVPSVHPDDGRASSVL